MFNKTMPYKLETVLCPLCGNDKYSVYIEGAKDLYNNLEGEFNVVKCDNCNFAYTNPRPTRETIGYFYPDSAGYYQPDEKKDLKKEKLKDRLFKSCLTRYYGYNMPKCIGLLDYFYHALYKKKFYKKHIPHFVDNGKLIDVGCSYGKWLKKMKNLGWDVYGIEFNESAVEYAKTQLGLQNVLLGAVEDVPCEEASFDVVHMSMVLEHVHNPVQVLKKASQIMKKDGELILSIPDISTQEAKIFKKDWYALHIPAHLNHFTPLTIKDILEKTGFKVQKIIHSPSAKDFILSAKHNKKLIYKLFKFSPFKNLLLRPYVNLVSLLGKTGRMTIYARKKIKTFA